MSRTKCLTTYGAKATPDTSACELLATSTKLSTYFLLGRLVDQAKMATTKHTRTCNNRNNDDDDNNDDDEDNKDDEEPQATRIDQERCGRITRDEQESPRATRSEHRATM